MTSLGRFAQKRLAMECPQPSVVLRICPVNLAASESWQEAPIVPPPTRGESPCPPDLCQPSSATLMLRNLPHFVTVEDVRVLMSRLVPAGECEEIYIPCVRSRHCRNPGYCFVRLANSGVDWSALHNYNDWLKDFKAFSAKRLTWSWAFWQHRRERKYHSGTHWHAV